MDGVYNRYLMIAGHIPFDHPAVQNARGRRAIYVAAMRDPVDRAVSFYDYVRRMPKHWLHEELQSLSLLDAFEQSDRFREHTVNRQLAYVFGAAAFSEHDRLLAERNYIIGRFDQLETLVDRVSAVSGLPRRGLQLVRRNSHTEAAKDAVTDGVPARRQLSRVLLVAPRTVGHAASGNLGWHGSICGVG